MRAPCLRQHLLAGLARRRLIVLACGAPTASADSIAYITGRQRLADHAGRRRASSRSTTDRRLQRTSPRPTTARSIALNGVRLHKLARDGAVLADFDTPVSDTRPAGSKKFYGPFDPAISPDGTKVAYTYY